MLVNVILGDIFCEVMLLSIYSSFAIKKQQQFLTNPQHGLLKFYKDGS